jgi:magnesium-protoporphyrin IX monomethyl ester (oxidative) cyclase
MAAAKSQGGIGGGLRRLGLGMAAGATFLRLYLMPGRKAALPDDVRLAPAW